MSSVGHLQAPEQIFHTVYSFGSIRYGCYRLLCLNSDGRVTVYSHQNERTFSFIDNKLTFFSETNIPGLCLHYINHGDGGLFLSDDRHYLILLITLQDGGENRNNARIIVNTVPKSGTYLCERILRSIGYHSLKLHLSKDALHDNRNVGSAETHRNVQAREIPCAASAIAAVMRPGDFAVGHIADPQEIRRCQTEGAGMIHCVRDLRDVLVSLMQFKRDVVGPRSPADKLWRSVGGREGFSAFLGFFAEQDIKSIIAGACAIAPERSRAIRFEDLAAGALPAANIDELDAIEPGLGGRFATALPMALGAPTSTLSRHRADFHEYWSDAAQAFYVESGLREANQAIGYDGG